MARTAWTVAAVGATTLLAAGQRTGTTGARTIAITTSASASPSSQFNDGVIVILELKKELYLRGTQICDNAAA